MKQVSERTFPMLGKVPKEHLKEETAFPLLRIFLSLKHAGAIMTKFGLWRLG